MSRRSSPRQQTGRRRGDYWVGMKRLTFVVMLSETRHEHAEQLLARAGMLAEGDSLYSATNISLMHHLYAALRAPIHCSQGSALRGAGWRNHHRRRVHGRLMPGRRWSDGLHQSVEAQRACRSRRKSQTPASITFQNYFRMYAKLSGMTGTADTEAYEIPADLRPETVVIPTHRPTARKDTLDQVYRLRPKIQGGHQRHPRLSSARPAGAGRHDLYRSLRIPVRPA